MVPSGPGHYVIAMVGRLLAWLADIGLILSTKRRRNLAYFHRCVATQDGYCLQLVNAIPYQLPEDAQHAVDVPPEPLARIRSFCLLWTVGLIRDLCGCEESVDRSFSTGSSLHRGCLSYLASLHNPTSRSSWPLANLGLSQWAMASRAEIRHAISGLSISLDAQINVNSSSHLPAPAPLLSPLLS